MKIMDLASILFMASLILLVYNFVYGIFLSAISGLVYFIIGHQKHNKLSQYYYAGTFAMFILPLAMYFVLLPYHQEQEKEQKILASSDIGLDNNYSTGLDNNLDNNLDDQDNNMDKGY